MTDDLSSPSPALRLPLIAGELAFDFANSVADWGGSQHEDYLPDGRDIIVWSHLAKLLSDAQKDAAIATIRQDEALARRLLAEAHALREVVHAVGAAVALRAAPREEDLADLANRHASYLAKARLMRTGEGFAWHWDPATDLLEAVLGPIALSALTVLMQLDLQRVKRCEGDHCGWLLFDSTKNRRRRWCEMEVCGNRAKMRAFKARKFEAR